MIIDAEWEEIPQTYNYFIAYLCMKDGQGACGSEIQSHDLKAKCSRYNYYYERSEGEIQVI